MHNAESDAKYFEGELLSALDVELALQVSAAGQMKEAITLLQTAVELEPRNTPAVALLVKLTAREPPETATSPFKGTSGKPAISVLI